MKRRSEEVPKFSPASFEESDEFYNFALKFFYFSTPLSVLASYTISYILKRTNVDWIFSLPSYLYLFHDRVVTLHAIDPVSPYFYIGTSIVFFLLFVPVNLIITFVYFTKVVNTGNVRPITTNGFYGIMITLFLIAITIWSLFFQNFDPSRGSIGLGRILLWPSFPLIGGSAAILLPMISFSIPAGIYKLISNNIGS